MKVTVTKYLNVRVGKPSVNAPCHQYLAPGSEIEVDGHEYKGDKYEGVDNWVKDLAGNYYWSGAIANIGSFTLPWWIVDFGIDSVWKISTGQHVTVFILDSGLGDDKDFSVTPTKYSVLGGNGDDKFGHGSLMASIIAGRGNKIHGIAPNASIVSIQITTGDKFVISDLIKGIAKVSTLISSSGNFIVNCSLAAENPSRADVSLIQNAFNSLLCNKNVTVCAAVGNGSQRNPSHFPVPASLAEIISVEGFRKSSDNHYLRLPSSNYWPTINLSAPGEYPIDQFRSTFPLVGGQGSSHACAFTSGLSALLLSSPHTKNKDRLSIIQKLNRSTKRVKEDSLFSNRIDNENLIVAAQS